VLTPAAKALPVIDTRNSVKIKKVRIRFTISRSLPIKRSGYTGCHAAGIFVIDAAIKLINTHLLSLLCQFRRKVNRDVHFDPYFIVLPLWLEFLYQFRYFLWGVIFSGVI